MMTTRRMFVAAALTAMALPAAVASAAAPDGFRALGARGALTFKVPADSMLVAETTLGARGVRMARYQQRFGDALVLGGELTVLRDAAGRTLAAVGTHYGALRPTNSVRLSPADARFAVESQRGHASPESRVDLMLDPRTGRYFYRVETRALASRWFHWIDAEDGRVLNAYDGLTTGTGIGVDGQKKDLTGLTRPNGSLFELASPDGRQTTYDAQGTATLPGVLATDDDDSWDRPGRTSPGQPALVDAQYYARVADNYLLSVHGFNWRTRYPSGMLSSAHFDQGSGGGGDPPDPPYPTLNNAFWTGSQVVYGDGDGSTFREFSGDLDVVAHEFAHGVTEATSGLVYQNESGALNEAFSDIMGTLTEFQYGTGNWTLAEDISFGNPIRDMANPGRLGSPSHYLDRYTGSGDNGGVHTNSGIANHWFYLLVNGGQNANPARRSGTSVIGIGLGPAEHIAFLGFTSLPSTAGFCQARRSTLAVASSSHASSVAAAWSEVGVSTALCGPEPDTIPPNATVTAPGSGAVVSGSTSVTCTASDNVGVTRVELLVDGVLRGSSTAAPYTFTWDTTTVADGDHGLACRAQDAALNSGTSATVTVRVRNAADGATFVRQTVPTSMIAGEKYNVSVTMRNSGGTTWTRDLLYRLGSQNPQDNNTWKIGRVLLPVGTQVAPTQEWPFSFQVTAPASPGTYNFQWRMLQENVAWFGDFSTNVAVNVVARYEGFHDAADCTSIRGWAWDKTLPNGPIDVDIFDGAALLARVSANLFRQDLLNAGKGNGYHAFDLPTPAALKNGVSHVIRVKFVATGADLGTTPRSLQCGGNRPPVAVNDAASGHSNTAIAINVTANDSDPDGNPVALTPNPIVTPPANGTALRLSGSSLQYTSVAGFTGTDTFQYEIDDGNGGRARAWVTVSVSNARPVAVDDAASVHVNTSITINVTANDSDPDGDAVGLIGSPIVVAPAHGTATKVSGSSISYTPAAGYQGSDTFQYEIGDGNGARARAWVNVTVFNHPPVAVNDSASTRKNVAVSINVTANDSDPDGDVPVLVGGGNWLVVPPAHGTVTKTSVSSVSYVPATGFTGTDTFQYEIGDGNGARARAWVSLTITP